jgi:hypothetical protein
MSKKDTVDYSGIAKKILKMIGGALLKLFAFVSWIILSGIVILLKEITASLKRFLFDKDM